MFAPLVAKAKSTGPQPAKAVDQAHTPRPSLGDQASFVAPQASQIGDAPRGQTTASAGAGLRAGLSWDFSKISLHPSGLAEQPQPSPLHWLPRLPIQAKLKVGAVDDPLEHEADRVADQVMRMPAPGAAMTSAPPQVSRKCAACEEQVSRKCAACEEEERLQKKEAAPATPALSEAPPSVHEALRAPGQPLDAATRAYFEPRFRHDFSGVRVHVDSAAAQSAWDVNAHAYTVGRDIAFDSGRFAPGSQEGRRLIAHELTHVVQQGGLGRIGDQRILHQLFLPTPSHADGHAQLRRQPAGQVALDVALARQDAIDRISEFVRKVSEQLDAARVDTAVSDEQAAPFFVREDPEVQHVRQQIIAGRTKAPAELAKLQRSLTLADKAYLAQADDLDALPAKIALVETLNSFTPALLRDTTEYEALLRRQKTGESDLADTIAFIEGIRRQIEITRRFLPERARDLAERSRLLEKEATSAAQKAGVKTDTRADLSQLTLLRKIIEASPTLRPYLTEQRAQGAQPKDLRNEQHVTIHSSQSDLEDLARATRIPIPRPPTQIGGFYDRRTDTIHLPPTAEFGDALHESVHKYSPTFFPSPGNTGGHPANLVTWLLDTDLNEGLTQYFADIILTDQHLQKSTHHQYQKELKCATRFVTVFGLDAAARLYFLGDRGQGALHQFLDQFLQTPQGRQFCAQECGVSGC